MHYVKKQLSLIICLISLCLFSCSKDQNESKEKYLDLSNSPATVIHKSTPNGKQFENIYDAQTYAIEKNYDTVEIQIEFNPQGFCQTKDLGIWLGKVYTSDIVHLNDTYIGQTGITNTKISLHNKFRAYYIPNGALRCGVNTLSLKYNRMIGTILGVGERIYIAPFAGIEQKKYIREAFSLFERDIGIILLALSFILFVIFRQSYTQKYQFEFSFFLFLCGFSAIILSGWIFQFRFSLPVFYIVNASIVNTLLAIFIRFQLRLLGPLKRLENTLLAFFLSLLSFTAIYIFGASFSLAFTFYQVITLVQVSTVIAIYAYSLKKIPKTYSLLHGILLAGAISDTMRIWNLHHLPNINLYTNGFVGVSYSIIFTSKIIPIFKNALDVQRAKKDVEVNDAIFQTIQMLAHDIKKPFTTLLAASNVVESAKRNQSNIQSIPDIKESISSSLSQVDNMLSEILELGVNIKKEVKSPVNIAEVILSSLKEVSQIYKQKDIFLEIYIDTNLQAWAQATKLQRAISNIIANSVEAIESKGKIIISTKYKENTVKIQISNTGSYIDEELYEDIFKPYFTKNKKKGTGLGLAIVKKIVETYKGSITVKSKKEPEKQVTFTITLPGLEQKDEANENITFHRNLKDYVPIMEMPQSKTLDLKDHLKGLNRQEIRRLNIAFIDDESIYSNSFTSLLEQEGLETFFNLKIFEDPEKFLKSDVTRLDLVITDLDLSHDTYDGFKIIKALSENTNFQGKICVHSNRSFIITHKANFLPDRPIAFLPKPINIEQFSKVIIELENKKT